MGVAIERETVRRRSPHKTAQAQLGQARPPYFCWGQRFTHPVGFDEADENRKEDGGRHSFRTFPKKRYHVLKGILQ